jgi:hypothetical protein
MSVNNIGSGKFGIGIQEGSKIPYRIWYKTETLREEAFNRLKTNKKLSIKRIAR